MNHTQEESDRQTEPLPTIDVDAGDTLPPMQVPDDMRTGQGMAESADESPATEWRQVETSSALNQDEVSTPPPLAIPPAVQRRPAPRQRSSCLLRFLVGLGLILALVSLALNILLIYSLMGVRQTAVDGLDQALNSLDSLEDEGFHYEYKYENTLPISVEIPVQQEMVIPFQGTFPINTTVRVPIDAGVLGTFVLDVPINTSVPVDVEVPVQISQTVAFSTSIPVSLTVPIDVQPDDPAIEGFINGLRQWLLELRGSFEVDVLSPLFGER